VLEQTSCNAAAHVADADKPKSGIFIGEQDIYLSILGNPTVAATKNTWDGFIRLAVSCLELPGFAESRHFFLSVQTYAGSFIGMLPMALGLGDGGEQNAPLGRAQPGVWRNFEIW
jgi:hypothetical protein